MRYIGQVKTDCDGVNYPLNNAFSRLLRFSGGEIKKDGCNEDANQDHEEQQTYERY